jgi:uncharacterized protein (DUF1330 family)
MAAYLIAHAKIKDQAKLQEYAAAAGPTLAAFGGAPVARGKVAAVLAGQHDGHTALVAKFPDVQSAKNWYNSPAYQALIPTRDQGMEPTFVLIEEPT